MRFKPIAVLFLAALLLRPSARADGVISIDSFAALCAFSDAVARGEQADARVRLIADICATSPFRPIGTATHMFSGHFDGQGHAITDLVAVGPVGSQGLFGSVSPDGVVENVSLERAFILGTGYAGGIAGYSAGRIENCRVMNSRIVNLSGATYGTSAGGIAGTASGRIAGCAAVGCSVRGPASVGGLCGAFHAGVLDRCAFLGVVACTGVGQAPCGGLAGSLHGGARMRLCVGCGAVLSFQNAFAESVAGGVFSGSSLYGAVFQGPEKLYALRALIRALSTPDEAQLNTNFQHLCP